MKSNLGVTDVMNVKGAVIQIHDDTQVKSMRNTESFRFNGFKRKVFLIGFNYKCRNSLNL